MQIIIIFIMAICMNALAFAQNEVDESISIEPISRIPPSQWTAPCVNGRFNRAGWCYGDISSDEFLSLNTKLGDLIAQVGVRVIPTPNSIFIAHYLGETGNEFTLPIVANQSPTIHSDTPSTTSVFCAYFSPSGASLMATGFAASYRGGAVANPSVPPITKINSGATVNIGNPAVANNIIPESAEFYLVCIGASNVKSLWDLPQSVIALIPS